MVRVIVGHIGAWSQCQSRLKAHLEPSFRCGREVLGVPFFVGIGRTVGNTVLAYSAGDSKGVEGVQTRATFSGGDGMVR